MTNRMFFTLFDIGTILMCVGIATCAYSTTISTTFLVVGGAVIVAPMAIHLFLLLFLLFVDAMQAVLHAMQNLVSYFSAVKRRAGVAWEMAELIRLRNKKKKQNET